MVGGGGVIGGGIGYIKVVGVKKVVVEVWGGLGGGIFWCSGFGRGGLVVGKVEWLWVLGKEEF